MRRQVADGAGPATPVMSNAAIETSREPGSGLSSWNHGRKHLLLLQVGQVQARHTHLQREHSPWGRPP